MAPEMKNGERYTEKIDIWSIGIVLFEHLYGGRIYRNVESSHPKKIEFLPRELENVSKVIKEKRWMDILEGCLTVNPEVRKSASEILEML
jgi:serine/threonine protein kinase